jgi:hypothetical protein
MHVAESPAPSGLRIAVFCTAAGLFAGAIAVVYELALSRHHWPPGHPWSGLSLSMFVVHAYLAAFGRIRARAWAMGVVVTLGILSTSLWVHAALLATR